MLKLILIQVSLLLFLSGCSNSQVKPSPEYIYVDKAVYVLPPDSLLIVPDEPRLEGSTNQDLINWSVDLREGFRQMKKKLELLKEWKDKSGEEE